MRTPDHALLEHPNPAAAAEAPSHERLALASVELALRAEAIGPGGGSTGLLRLEPGEALGLSYDAAGTRLSCRIAARARRAEPAQARAAAAELAAQVEALVPVRRLAGESANTGSGYRAQLRPDGVLLYGRRGVGFLADAASPSLRFALPAAPGHTPATRLEAALATAEPELVLGVDLRAFRLTTPALRALAAFAAGEVIACYSGTGQPVRAPAMLSALLEQAEAWLRHGAGVRLRWWLAAPSALGAGSLARLAGLLADGGEWQSATAIPPTTLDLASALPGLSLPLPLPGGSAFRARPCGSAKTVHKDALRLGEQEQGAAASPVLLGAVDRAQHCYVLGGSGTGKSSLLAGMIGQDIAAGRGVCVLDPHGDLTADVLARVPARRLRDLVLLDPGDPKRAPGLNLLEPPQDAAPERHAAFAINEMMRIFARLYDMSIAGGPMFEKYMRNALSLVIESRHRGGTLVDVPWLFEDEDYRKALIRQCTNPYTVSFWCKEAATVRGDGALANMAPYITCKLNQFTHNAVLRPIIGQSRSTLDLGACMREGRILLVNLAKGALGTLDARLLGMLLLAKLLATALARPAGSARAPFYLYVDEAQSFATDTLAELLAEARKFGLHMTLANQNLGQLDGQVPGLRDALLGNVGNLLCLRLGPADAGLVADYMAPTLDMRALQFLGNFRVAARMLTAGEPAPPFLFRTDPPAPLPRRRPATEARRESTLTTVRQRYSRPVVEVERALQGRRKRILMRR